MLKQLVNCMAELAHFNIDQVLVDDSKVEAVWLLGEPPCRILLRYKPNIAPLCHDFNGHSVLRVFHQRVKLPRDVVYFALSPCLCCF